MRTTRRWMPSTANIGRCSMPTPSGTTARLRPTRHVSPSCTSVRSPISPRSSRRRGAHLKTDLAHAFPGLAGESDGNHPSTIESVAPRQHRVEPDRVPFDLEMEGGVPDFEGAVVDEFVGA